MTNKKKIPYILRWDKMPLDISGVFKDEKPAVKHGFLKVRGEDFVFEDGTKAAFWGTNFNAGANFPEHSYSEKVAKRLAATGINIVRLHQLDADWSTPNIFEFNKGTMKEDTRSFDPESMDRLDYLIYCLKNEGIYIYMDFITYRRFRTADGVPNAHMLRTQGRPFCVFNRILIELQKEFNKNFLEHLNPYTGLKYKDEPAIAMAELLNETELLATGYVHIDNVEPYMSELRGLLREYDTEGKIDADNYDFNSPERDPLVTRFLFDLQQKYYVEMLEHLRESGAKFPVTGTNWAITKATPLCNSVFDFTDGHEYYILGNQKKFHNVSMIKSDYFIPKRLTFNCIKGKPFFCSEWDMPWPNEYRAEAPIVLAAIGAFQNWGGYTIHTYRYGTNTEDSVTHKIGRSVTLGGGKSRGTFDTYNDPAKYGLFYHCALIMRRGDVKPAKERAVKGFSKDYVMENYGYDYDIIGKTVVERHKVCMDYDVPSEGDIMYSEDEVLSDTGEIYRDLKEGYGSINTDMTKAVYGFVGGREIPLDGVTIKAESDFATIALSSLTNEKITESSNILLTAVGRADNTDAVYNEEHTSLIKEGKPPILVDVINAEICIKTNRPNLMIYAVNDEGFYISALKSTYEDGVLKFKIGEEFESIYYLIQAL